MANAGGYEKRSSTPYSNNTYDYTQAQLSQVNPMLAQTEADARKRALQNVSATRMRGSPMSMYKTTGLEGTLAAKRAGITSDIYKTGGMLNWRTGERVGAQQFASEESEKNYQRQLDMYKMAIEENKKMQEQAVQNQIIATLGGSLLGPIFGVGGAAIGGGIGSLFGLGENTYNKELGINLPGINAKNMISAYMRNLYGGISPTEAAIYGKMYGSATAPSSLDAYGATENADTSKYDLWRGGSDESDLNGIRKMLSSPFSSIYNTGKDWLFSLGDLFDGNEDYSGEGVTYPTGGSALDFIFPRGSRFNPGSSEGSL